MLSSPPQSKTDIRSFLGCVNYFRKFIRNFSTIAEPLNRLLGQSFSVKQWGPKQDNAVTTLKAALMTAPILAFPDYEKEFHVTTDEPFTSPD
jgi:hypothetical protein